MTNFGEEIKAAETFHDCIEIYKRVIGIIKENPNSSSNREDWIIAYDVLKKALKLARTKESADEILQYARRDGKGRKNFQKLATNAKNKIKSLKV